jgi:flavin-dependent dehydrogenase
MSSVCVIGAGPAGSTFAARLAQMGHDVTIVECAEFPRARLGESLSPGVLPLLESTGARTFIESARFPRIKHVWSQWDEGLQLREDPREQGMLVDRGRFDGLLLEHASALGVRVLQPARVRNYCDVGGRWTVDIETERGPRQLEVDFVADSSGRSSKGSRHRIGCRTVALHGYWRGQDLPREPRIEAGADAWYWGVPLPDGTYNTLVFVDVNHFRDAPESSLTARFLELLGESELLASCCNAYLDGPVRVSDATAWLSEDSVTASSIRLGEAAIALDPLSSSGVQKAIQSALAGAVVANTLLRKPDSASAAIRFYRNNLEQTSIQHSRWAAEHYGKVALTNKRRFWTERARGAQAEPESTHAAVPFGASSAMRVRLSSSAEFIEEPCLEGEFVAVKSAVRHPSLDRPVVWLAGTELAPLLGRIEAPSTPLEIAVSWLDRVPLDSGLKIAGWLIQRGILTEASPVGPDAIGRAAV